MSNFATIEPALDGFIAALNAALDRHYSETLAESHARGWTPTHELERGQKYIRVVQVSMGSRSAFCFLDGDGNIYKADGWKKPAKGIRGRLSDPNYSIGKGLTVYGGATYRR